MPLATYSSFFLESFFSLFAQHNFSVMRQSIRVNSYALPVFVPMRRANFTPERFLVLSPINDRIRAHIGAAILLLVGLSLLHTIIAVIIMGAFITARGIAAGRIVVVMFQENSPVQDS